MSLQLYMDVHIPAPITKALRGRGIGVLTSQEDKTDKLEDGSLLDRATALGRVVFTFDDDFLVEAASRQSEGIHFAGIIILTGDDVLTSVCVEELDLLCQVYDPEDIANRVEFLPLK